MVVICQNILGFGEGVTIKEQKEGVLVMYPNCADEYKQVFLKSQAYISKKKSVLLYINLESQMIFLKLFLKS